MDWNGSKFVSFAGFGHVSSQKKIIYPTNSYPLLKKNVDRFLFYICDVCCDTVKVYYSPTNAQVIVLRTILKFTLK